MVNGGCRPRLRAADHALSDCLALTSFICLNQHNTNHIKRWNRSTIMKIFFSFTQSSKFNWLVACSSHNSFETVGFNLAFHGCISKHIYINFHCTQIFCGCMVYMDYGLPLVVRVRHQDKHLLLYFILCGAIGEFRVRNNSLSGLSVTRNAIAMRIELSIHSTSLIEVKRLVDSWNKTGK